jgi:hypothetical protein
MLKFNLHDRLGPPRHGLIPIDTPPILKKIRLDPLPRRSRIGMSRCTQPVNPKRKLIQDDRHSTAVFDREERTSAEDAESFAEKSLLIHPGSAIFEVKARA